MSSGNPVTGADSSQNENLNANFTAPSSTNPTTATNQMSAQMGGGEGNAGSKFSSMANLREEAPKLYKAMMEGAARQICDQVKKGQERYKKAIRGQE